MRPDPNDDPLSHDVVADACGSIETEVRVRALASVDYSLFSHMTDTDTLCRLLRAAPRPGPIHQP